VKRLATLVVLVLAAMPSASVARPDAAGADWPLFGFDTARHGAGAPSTGITSGNVSSLKQQRVSLDGTVDSSPIYLHGVKVHGATHDVFFVTTTYGRTEAIDAANGQVLWRFVPASYDQLARSAQITNATPAADPSRSAIYAAAPDGRIRKLRVADGRVLWTATITRDATHEKITSSLNVSRGLVIATTGGYVGDAPPYQGHVVTLHAGNGRIAHVWNSLCSDRHQLIVPRTCRSSDSAIWSRSGAAVDPANGNLVVATGNGPWNGSTDWGDSALVLSPDASRLLRHYTPANQAALESSDADLGSTSPALLAGGHAVQGGKDGILRLLQLHRMPGVNKRTGGELQTLPAPGATDVFSEPAVWRGSWVFVATGGGTQAFRLAGSRLHAAWSSRVGGTSPVVAGGLLYVASEGAIHVFVPTSGHEITTLATGPLHWQSPVVADGRVAITEGNANDHATNGVLDIYTR
jgi:outer membrane protein assembly factor BamB